MQRYEEYLECANIVHKILQIVPFGERIAKILRTKFFKIIKIIISLSNK